MGRIETIQTGFADLERYHQGRRNSGGAEHNKRVEGSGIL